ncbi:glycosyltransferase [Lactovum odontotermitis]
MNYFLNENIFTLNSGTEFSAIKRLQLFKQHGLPAKILTRNYNSNSAADIERVDLEPSDVLNLYDYFQEADRLPKADAALRYTDVIDKRLYHIESLDANASLIRHHGRVIGKVRIAPATVGLVGTIDWYNDNMTVTARDIWDRRGFKSSTQYFHPDGALGPQIFFDSKGQPKIELTHMNVGGTLTATSWKLLDYQGKAWHFTTEEDFFAFFASEMARKEAASFICDRPSLTGALVKIEEAYGKWQYLHNTHTADHQPAGASGELAAYLEPLFTVWRDQIDGLIVPTEQQRDEIREQYNFAQVLALPDTYAEIVNPDLLSCPREQSIVCLGLMSAAKGSLDAVEILARVREQLPHVRLKYYGYASPMDFQQEIEDRAKELAVEEFVEFPGYKTEAELAGILSQSGVLLNTSEGEAFGMGVLKAMSCGTPAVAYQVKYGLDELIQNGQNGNLVPYGDVQAAADAIVRVLSDPDLQAAYSAAAYTHAQNFSADTAWLQWENARQLVNHLFVEV